MTAKSDQTDSHSEVITILKACQMQAIIEIIKNLKIT